MLVRAILHFFLFPTAIRIGGAIPYVGRFPSGLLARSVALFCILPFPGGNPHWRGDSLSGTVPLWTIGVLVRAFLHSSFSGGNPHWWGDSLRGTVPLWTNRRARSRFLHFLPFPGGNPHWWGDPLSGTVPLRTLVRLAQLAAGLA